MPDDAGRAASARAEPWIGRCVFLAQGLGYLYLLGFGVGLLLEAPAAVSVGGLWRAFLVTAALVVLRLHPAGEAARGGAGRAADALVLTMIATTLA